MTSGGPHGIHTKNIFSDLHVEVIVRLENDSTSASGICRRRGVRRLRHLHRKELWLQNQVAAKNVELERGPSEDNEADLGNDILGTRSYQEVCDQGGNVVCRGVGWRTVACGFGH